MPERYRSSFDGDAIQKHAAIVARRAGFSVHVEIWQPLPDGSVALCVVADDRPGLLSFVSASLVVHDLDVIAVKAYTRTRSDGRAEAVDFFWVRRQAEPSRSVERGDIERIGA